MSASLPVIRPVSPAAWAFAARRAGPAVLIIMGGVSLIGGVTSFFWAPQTCLQY